MVRRNQKSTVKREKQQPQPQPSSSRKKPSVVDFLASPTEPQPNTPTDTPNYHTVSPPSTSRRKSPVPSKETVNATSSGRREIVSSLAELKELASSRLDSMKRLTERSHADILKEVDSSNSRLNKRLKIQTQACQKLMDDTDKEFKKMLERITESCEAMKESYAEIQAEAQATHSRVCKTTIPEKAKEFEDVINAFHKRYVTA